MTPYHLAQLNIANMKYSVGSAKMFEFVDNLNRINALLIARRVLYGDYKATMVMRQAFVFLDQIG